MFYNLKSLEYAALLICLVIVKNSQLWLWGEINKLVLDNVPSINRIDGRGHYMLIACHGKLLAKNP